MTARTKSSVTSTPRPSRASKEKAKMTIKTATVPKFESPHLPEIFCESPVRISSPISRPVTTPVWRTFLRWQVSLGRFSQSNQRIYRDDLMDGIERTIRDTMSEVFASRDGKERERKFATPATVRRRGRYFDEGGFQIDGLSKLHSTDELRNTYLKKSLNGVYQPLEGGPAKVIIGITELQSSFKEPSTCPFVRHLSQRARRVWSIGRRGCSISFI